MTVPIEEGNYIYVYVANADQFVNLSDPLLNPDDIPDSVKRRRNNELLALQTRISDEISREQIGRRFAVFVEGISRTEMKKRGTDVKPGNGMVGITVGGRDPAAAATLELPDTQESVQLSGRTDSDLIVFFEAPSAHAKRLPGTIVEIEVTGAERLALTGILQPRTLSL